MQSMLPNSRVVSITCWPCLGSMAHPDVSMPTCGLARLDSVSAATQASHTHGLEYMCKYCMCSVSLIHAGDPHANTHRTTSRTTTPTTSATTSRTTTPTTSPTSTRTSTGTSLVVSCSCNARREVSALHGYPTAVSSNAVAGHVRRGHTSACRHRCGARLCSNVFNLPRVYITVAK